MSQPISKKIAVVQYGDYSQAVQIFRTGGKEPYSGMRHSVETLERLFGEDPYLVISLNGPPYREVIGNGLSIGVPAPAPRLWRRGLLNKRHWAGRICDELEAFAPTHLLMRAAGHVALKVLQLSTRRGWETLALFANNFQSADRAGRRIERKLLPQYLNHPSVRWVGNHRQASSQSLINCGVDPTKIIAYDWPAPRLPSQFEPKRLDRSRPAHLMYAASMVIDKGIGDLIEAVGILKRKGKAVRLTAFGLGPDLPQMKELAGRIAPNDIEFPGQVDNDVLFQNLRQSTVMCVATRPSIQEGGSLVLTEALASRTPTVLSDQVMFTRSFQDLQGVRFFKAGDPSSLADTIDSVISNDEMYSGMSESTSAAFERVVCKTTFGQVLARWKSQMDVDGLAEKTENAFTLAHSTV